MHQDIPRIFQEVALVSARLGIWNKKFVSVFERLKNSTLQKVSASDEGYLTLHVYKPGDDRTAVLLNIKRGESGISSSMMKPASQPKPNSIVQVMRKYLVGRRVKHVYASLIPSAVIIEFDDVPDHVKETEKDSQSFPDTLILDLESKPARISVAKKYLGVPQRYSQVAAAYSTFDPFYESFCEWTLESTKTKRRACFDTRLLSYCTLYQHVAESNSEESPGKSVAPHLPALPSQESMPSEEKEPEKMPDLTIMQALAALPTHVRRAAKTKLQFLERRLMRQKGDLPSELELQNLEKRSESLRAHLYLWPKNSTIWYVPPQLIEEAGLPPMITLKAGQSPGDLLNTYFHELERLQRREKELKMRLAESQKALENFQTTVLQAGTAFVTDLERLEISYSAHGLVDKQKINVLLTKIEPPEALRLCQQLDISWRQSEQKRQIKDELIARRLPYRSYKSSTGEFIRVAKSSSDSDKMLRLMPTNHIWMHVLTGEGSHVWLEKPKKANPSPAAMREASVLAVHHSKQGRGQSAEVRIARRADVEKKKDLAPGKVLVRRCDTLLIKYEDAELDPILAATI